MAEAAANGFGKAEAPPKPAVPGPYAVTLDQEKRTLQNKLWELQKSGVDGKAKWWSFCKIHAEGNTDPKNHDVAFLQTFFESYEAGDIGIEEGCPFTAAPKGGKDSSKGWGKDGGKAGGKDGGKDFGKGWGKDSGKGWGKDSGKGWGKDSGSKGGKGDKGGKSGGGGGGKPNDCKIFVGGLPQGCTEDELKAHFAYYGTVAECNMKYDDWGGFRGFAFVVFDSSASAQSVLADAANQNFKGKWIDCKNPTANTGGGGDKGGSKGGDKGGKFDKGGKGGGKFDKGGKGGGKFDKGGKGGGKFDKGGKGGKDKGGGWGGGKW